MIEARKLTDAVYRGVLSKRRDGLQACLDKFDGGDLRRSGMFAVSIPSLPRGGSVHGKGRGGLCKSLRLIYSEIEREDLSSM